MREERLWVANEVLTKLKNFYNFILKALISAESSRLNGSKNSMVEKSVSSQLAGSLEVTF
jgi:hypothetical protein